MATKGREIQTAKNNKKSFSNNDERSYEVEKIINQRTINGKKQYKVIWVGCSFEDATWEPEENLSCPQKIVEFARRYEEVLRRKMMNKSLSTDRLNKQPQNNNKISVSAQKPIPTSSLSNVPAKITIPSLPKKTQLREQPRTNMTKNSFTAPNRQIKQLKETIMENARKKMKVNGSQYEDLGKENIKERKIGIKPTITSPINRHKSESLNDTESSCPSECIQKNLFDELFMPIEQRLDIEEILGVTKDYEGTPLFFLIKNKFSESMQLVQRKRLIKQCPQKLLEFYESLYWKK